MGRRAAFLLLVALGVPSCRNYVAMPIYRRPAITSVVASPDTLAPGDSTRITVTAIDPDGDALVYDWEAWNGLILPGHDPSFLFSTDSSSIVVHRNPSWPYPNDTAFVFCSARDQKGGSDTRRVWIFFRP